MEGLILLLIPIDLGHEVALILVHYKLKRIKHGMMVDGGWSVQLKCDAIDYHLFLVPFGFPILSH